MNILKKMSDDQADTDDSTAALIEAFMKERAYKETLRWTFNLFHFYVVFSILRGNQGIPVTHDKSIKLYIKY